MSFLALAFALSVAACGGGGGGDSDGIATASAATGTSMKALAVTASDTVTTTDTWTPCASEGGTCAFSGTAQVRYGTDTQFVVQTLTGGTACTNAVFGDPAFGYGKTCSYAPVTTTASAVNWIACASEGGTCSFSGTRQVRYGTTTQNVIGTFTSQTACSNAVFGDPAYGIGKSCWYADTTSATTPTTTTWIACANEGGYCSFSGTQQVQYGTAIQYVTATYTGGVACNNTVFGDPAYGQSKTCRYGLTTTTTTPTTPAAPAPGASGTNPPIVFNASASGRPGDVVSLQGENFGTAPSVYFEGAASAPLTIVNQVGTGWLAVQIPTSAPAALLLRISNGTGISAQVALNAAHPLHLDTLQLTPGGAFRVFGRNLLLAGSTPTVTVGGVAATLDLVNSNEYMLTATAPATLAASSAAVIVVDNGNGTGPATLDRSVQTLASGSGDPYGLGVGWASAYTPIAQTTINAATDPRLPQHMACDGSSDDAVPIQAAIDLAAANGGGTVTLPAGNCRLIGRMNLRSNVVVQGAGKTATVLTYDSDYAFSGTGIDLAGVRNLSMVNSGVAVEGPLLKDSTRVMLQNVHIVLNTSRQMYLSGNTQFAVQGSDFVQTSGISGQGPYTFANSAGLLFENNLTQWAMGAPTFGWIHDAYVHGNHFTRDGRAQNLTGSTVHSLTLDFAYRVAVLGNTFDVAYGPITNKTRNDGETILTEGGGAARTENLGNVASADATSISDPNNTINIDPFSTGVIPEDYGVVIVGGKGAGQTRRLIAYSQPKITVDRAWDVIPDSTSRYATFVYGLEKSLIKDNVLSQNPRGIWLYHTAIREVDVIGNSISEGGGIYLRSYQNLSTKSFMPIYNVLIARNTIVNTTQQWGSYINSVFVNGDAQAFGIATLGVEMRSNLLTTNQPNLSSAYEEYAGTEGYMNMMRIESSNAYVSSTMPRLLGSILANNTCTNCAVAVRVGTGAGGTTILGTQLVNGGQMTDDWATAGTSEKSTGTVVH